MALLVWQERYSVGIREIDEQHKQLINLINELNNAMLAGKGKEAVLPVLTKLSSHCVTHFNNEERLFETHAYPDAADHKEKHNKLTAEVNVLIDGVKSGKNKISIEVMRFLITWLDKHIMETDMKYVPHLHSAGVK